ncbi:MATE family efflux transporter [Cyclobacterium amurskyense]|uniref:Multidrug export protein MepA n=1 Tax=Cyclobacterium amurskyense TaxID=320787 RepID=A0A0H4PN75_9BACT|nr:MATE family efflux transporter [Cyclobacterium amurskyense]AKP49717.1 Multi antimicrobial extrusion protein (Na(+)/drug antiporter) [Cyclobacterium amurskyense]|tara:strand:- start:149 stop:1480 length:1332 start_codon:yes stop_codon:yes gene_type:complete
MENKNHSFGQDPIGKLLLQQALPAAVGILVLSIYGIVDTIFVGRFVGSLGIATITVVLPISFLISSIGMSIGVGGASIISRAYGDADEEKAFQTFGNQIGMTLTLALLFVAIGFIFSEEILKLFGGKGDVLAPAQDYFTIILIGIPFLAWAMMCNNVIRAEGYPKVAMYTLIVPAVFNIVLDPIFIVWFDMGLKGAAWATTISYVASAGYSLWFFVFGKSNMKMSLQRIKPNYNISSEITSLGAVTFARQGTVSVLAIVLNNELFKYGGELGLSMYGVISRVMMFANFPVLGITQGFVPIAGYNHGAKLQKRVHATIKLALRSATIVAFLIFVLILIFTEPLVAIFTADQDLIRESIPAMRKSFLATPLLAFSLIGSAYFQSVGKAKPALLLALSKQGIFLIPLVIIMPALFGLEGIWYSFPLADTGAAIISYFFLKKETNAI